ncbi:MAG: response regulator [Chloroflexi bacterium]|jgi:DNA-binding response OmpR family regulator|nr:response regulator [Chloroflexota bacterium]
MVKTTDRGTVLIIEDNAGYRRVYQDALEAEGYEIIDADDGEWGLQLALDEKPDLILLDLILPGMHGFEVLKEIRAHLSTRSIPVIVFSVLGEGKDVRKAMDLGANDYAVKGAVLPREMLSKVRHVLGEAGSIKEESKYQVAVNPLSADAAPLSRAVGLNDTMMCPHCNGEMTLELIRDGSCSPGHWFAAHFICSKCAIQF